MKSSTERILTTHVGSLPRSDDLVRMLHLKEKGEAYDQAQFDRCVAQSVDKIVARQVAAKIDLVSDGEMSKISYATYLKDRLNGFNGTATENRAAADLVDFIGYARRLVEQGGTERSLQGPACDGPLSVRDAAPLQKDLTNFTAAIRAHQPTEGFLTASSPGVVSVFLQNQYYPDDDAYLEALAGILKEEYEAIVAAGVTLQLDCPDLAMGRHVVHRKKSVAEFRRVVAHHVEVLNAATANISPESMRIHLCWGNYQGPHHHDIDLSDILDLVYRARPHAISMEAANPRHEHEWAVFDKHPLPDEKIVIPGVIDSTSNFIEHPELVAQRICRYANKVGRERVIAGTDCGFATFAERPAVDPEIAWAKLASLVEGAAVASRQLW
ncbi:MAG: cobalamin-independent methionine synthase II family protein [Arenicellales bacterium]|jgi:5-methyltetrahydropteroyltriglutamate--homocysteine methyltransferase|nr:epoxyalkane--coenzyme M transferase [Acidiferrobacteraceae bacterium]MDP6136851.1 cobalamin-independent methionine synthase II family protein [Arenicellales bacterium]MDP6392230.1 cobalamin-independent methionine synthase II family protein [Arenicellales bacterium]MDP7220346.1 cobalamin-independent methionine synthase II family protein [Arenicellales bacterium]HJP08838.1 cobalamin-independent methionine synthase II family protein [Arenicellales bacterium]|tara:strand:- start:1424 stop:2572 length:1149 start_codon:yes stop_codon:yes gene_type:complete